MFIAEKMATKTITPSEILNHRKMRKQSGMAGCITGRPQPTMDFFGFRDIMIWNMDAEGRLNGDPGFNRMDPRCFCFDCRESFDSDGTVDAELVNTGHVRACFVYASLLSKRTESQSNGFSNEPPLTSTTCSVAIPQRSNGGGISVA
jgi:hypothetical protein